MRLTLYAGLLGLGIGLGALLGLHFYERSFTPPHDPLVDEYVGLVGVLFARGESLAVVQARLERLGFPNTAAVVREVAGRAAGSPGEATQAAAGDVAGMLAALTPAGADALPVAPRIVASGRGAGSTPAVHQDQSVPSALAEFPTTGRISPNRGDAFLRSNPSRDAPVLRVVPRGGEVVLLATERGQAIEGAEDRWYLVQHGDATGYIYFSLVERVQ